MPRCSTLAILSLCAASAIAQPSQGSPGAGERQPTRESRRAELRVALQAGRQVEAQSAATDVSGLAGRQLSDRERAEIRRQLREQQSQALRNRP